MRMRHDEAIAAGERAIRLAPNVATNHAALALVFYYSGRFEDCLARIRKAMRLSPYFPAWFLVSLGEGYRGIGDLPRARQVFEHYAARAPNSLLPQTRLACVLAELGQLDRARAVAQTVLALDPDFSSGRFANASPLKYPAEREKFATGLRAAGLPE